MSETEREFAKAIEALDDIFQFLKEFFQAAGIARDDVLSLQLIVEELFTNMVKYGGGASPWISLGVERVGDRVQIRLTDWGAGPFDPGSLKPVDPEASFDERRPGGLGLHLVRAMADEVRFDYLNPGMTVLVTKTLERSHV